MSLGVLNNIAAIYAQNNLNNTQASLQNTLTQLSSGSRINSGADDAAGLAVAIVPAAAQASGLRADLTTVPLDGVDPGHGVLSTRAAARAVLARA